MKQIFFWTWCATCLSRPVAQSRSTAKGLGALLDRAQELPFPTEVPAVVTAVWAVSLPPSPREEPIMVRLLDPRIAVVAVEREPALTRAAAEGVGRFA